MSASAVMADPEELIPTRDSLLSRLKDRDDADSWQDFFNTYWKLIYGVAIKAGLTDQEAQEVVQETVITVARRNPEIRYDPNVCAFKTWLLNLTRWRIVDQLRRRKPDAQFKRRKAETSARTPTVERIADPGGIDLETMWDEEWEHYILEAAIERVKKQVSPEQFQIFALRVFKEWPVTRIARELDVSIGQVYLAKHRISALIRKQVKELEKKMT
jgi:RNA polymerase sigma factor (sigma-70 family)